MKTLTIRNREEKEKYRVPRRVQDTIPIRTVWPDGIFLAGNDRYSKTFQFQDINYAVASLEDKENMLKAYCALRYKIAAHFCSLIVSQQHTHIA